MKSGFLSIRFIVLIMAFILANCKKETKDSLFGKWDVTTHIYTVYQNNIKFSEENYTYAPGEFVVVFNADGTGKFLENGKDGVTFTLKGISGNKYTIIEQVDPFNTTTADLELIINENTLTWNSTGTYGVYKLVNHMVCNRL